MPHPTMNSLSHPTPTPRTDAAEGPDPAGRKAQAEAFANSPLWAEHARRMQQDAPADAATEPPAVFGLLLLLYLATKIHRDDPPPDPRTHCPTWWFTRNVLERLRFARRLTGAGGCLRAMGRPEWIRLSKVIRLLPELEQNTVFAVADGRPFSDIAVAAPMTVADLEGRWEGTLRTLRTKMVRKFGPRIPSERSIGEIFERIREKVIREHADPGAPVCLA